MSQAALKLRGHNPDVLTCIANLSNDEVFTPPELANRMLDGVTAAWAESNGGANIWANPDVTFLDPFTKSGVFLREITKRLVDGLTDEIPDLAERVDHILTKQVFGIAITELTSLLARRSLYCSKYANGKHSIARSFTVEDGNIWFERTEHDWAGGRCRYCGANQEVLDRGGGLETHAYALIHTSDVRARLKEIFGDNVRFDVIIGNPPYQLEADAAGQNVMPIYNLFVEQAKALEPKLLCMVTPSRWMAGGKYLDDFRAATLNDRRISVLVDYPNAADVFPSVGINGGVCYFLWDAQHDGDCAVSVVRSGRVSGPYQRRLNEFDVFIRDIEAVNILHKVQSHGEPSLAEMVSARDPFGPALSSNFTGYSPTPRSGYLRLHMNFGTRRETTWVAPHLVTKNVHLVDSWKVLVPKAGSGRERERSGVDLVLGPPLIASPGSVCTLTYVVVGPLKSAHEAASLESYLKTRFARFLISLRKITQDAPRGVYTFAPQQTWDRIWTDTELFEKYNLTEDEVEYIVSIIRPMDSADG